MVLHDLSSGGADVTTVAQELTQLVSIDDDDSEDEVCGVAARETFERHVRYIHAGSHRHAAPCVLDVNPTLATHFAIGAIELVEDDLRRVLDARTAERTLTGLVAGGLQAAFAMRRELVNFKKACLIVLHDIERLIVTMTRQASFFARETTRCAAADKEGHDCATCRQWRIARRTDLRFCLRGTDGHEDAAPQPGSAVSASTAENDARQLHILERLKRLRGVRLATLDMRMLLKAICHLPRHPDDHAHIPPSLLHGRMNDAFYAAAAVGRAEAEGAVMRAERDGSARTVQARLPEPTAAAPIAAPTASPSSTTALLPSSATKGEAGTATSEYGLRADSMTTALGTLLACLPPKLPTHVVHYVRQSLIARGAGKALAQVDGAKALMRTLAQQQHRTAEALAALACVAPAAARVEEVQGEAANEPTTEAATEDASLAALDRALGTALSHAMRWGNHVHTLRGLHGANEALLASLRLVLGAPLTAGDPSVAAGAPGVTPAGAQAAAGSPVAAAASPAHGRRLFAASDASTKGHSAMCFPPCFAPLVQTVRGMQDAAANDEQRLRHAIADGGWPPSWWSPRQAGQIEGGPHCRVCHRRYPRLWQDRGVCWRCDETERACGRCPYAVRSAKGRAKAHPFCPHQSRCAACDPGFVSCMLCRLACGDGEAVLAACEAWSPSHVFLDFDQTLCSTKSGGDPLKGGHSLNPELHEVANRYAAHVLTRNRHTEQIRAFLDARGVPILGIHSTPTGKSKACYMQQVLGGASEQDATAVFVDDDANEVHDPRVAADARIFRVLACV